MVALTNRPETLPRTVGQCVFAVLVIFVVAGLPRATPASAVVTIAAAVVAVVAGGFAILGPQPWDVAAAAVSTAGIAVLANGTASNIAWFGLCLLAGWCALNLAPPLVAATWGAAMTLLVVEFAATTHDPGWTAWLGGTTFSVVGCLFGRRQHELVTQLRAAQAGLTQRAQADERNRIARELHDVIAHSLTVSLLHVSAARLALADAPEDAAQALAEAERLGRASLDEVRHAVGLLHREGAPDPTTPLPGSTDVPTLIAGFTSAGADVHADITGDLAALPAAVGLTAYRILQEALTNAAKHAPRARVTVGLCVAPDTVTVDVDSAGPAQRGAGLGLTSMRERAAALGGTCETGPGGSGWRVHAVLPLLATGGDTSDETPQR